ncbi:MAG: DUF5995 family protein [Myxococcota bacterium]|nr:DUF5995 family protein [Myxococcota bacterium]
MRLRRTDDVVAYLRGVCDRVRRGDLPPAYGPFALAYHRMTLEQIARIPCFEDPAWASGFTVAFAERYRDALENPRRRTGPWRVAFAHADRSDRPLRDLLLGINAHMAYDLALTLVDCALDEPDRRRADYLGINRLLATAVDPVQAGVARQHRRWLAWADKLSGRLDERVTLSGFQRTRARAWSDAIEILQGRRSRGSVEARVTRRARRLSWLPV